MNNEFCNIKELSSYFRIGNRIMFDLKSINNWVEKLEKKESEKSFFTN